MKQGPLTLQPNGETEGKDQQSYQTPCLPKRQGRFHRKLKKASLLGWIDAFCSCLEDSVTLVRLPSSPRKHR